MAFAGVAGTLTSLSARGSVAVAEFVWAAAVACLSVAAAWALLTRALAALPLARAAIVFSAVRELQRLAWTALPSDVIPGTQGWIAAAVVLFAVALMAGVRRCARAYPAD